MTAERRSSARNQRHGGGDAIRPRQMKCYNPGDPATWKQGDLYQFLTDRGIKRNSGGERNYEQAKGLIDSLISSSTDPSARLRDRLIYWATKYLRY